MLVARLLLLLSVLLAVSQAQSQAGECGKFRQESCQAKGSQVLAVVRGIQSALECQVGCITALQGPLAPPDLLSFSPPDCVFLQGGVPDVLSVPRALPVCPTETVWPEVILH